MSRPLSQIRYGNRLIQQKQQTSTLQKHYESLRKARPMTGNAAERNTIMLNNKKRQMVQENRFTEIERQNRILFHKISSIMNKGTISQNLPIRESSIGKMNKTLNGGYRKKEMQKIEFENAKMLQRLKEKKSSYGVTGLQKDWQRNKKVIKKMSLYPFILNDNAGAQIKRQRLNGSFLMRQYETYSDHQQLEVPRQIRRVRKINGSMFLVTLKFEGNKLFIIGDIKEEQNIKIIELEKKEAQSFIIDECDGNVENVFGLLRFDRESGDLYLVGKNVGEIEQVKEFQVQRRRVQSHQGLRGRTAGQSRSRIQPQYHPPRPMSKQLTRKKNHFTLDSNNNEEYMEFGFGDVKSEQKIKINSNLDLLQHQMNRQIPNKMCDNRNSESGEQHGEMKKQEINMNVFLENNKQPLWVKVQKKQTDDIDAEKQEQLKQEEEPLLIDSKENQQMNEPWEQQDVNQIQNVEQIKYQDQQALQQMS